MPDEKIHIVGVEVSNFRRLRVAQVRLDREEGLVRVTGKNAAGKTSLLRAIQGVLGGAKAVPEGAIHDGEAAGNAKLLLSNGYTVERRFTHAAPKGYLTITSADGGKYGQAKLDEWLGALSFDPLAFMSLPIARQKEILLGLGKDPDLAAKLEELDEKRKRLYDERTPFISQKRHYNAVPKPEHPRPEPIDTMTEMNRLRELEEVAAALQTQKHKIERYENELRRIDDEIADLEGRIADLKLRREQGTAALQAAQDAYDESEDPTTEIEAIKGRLAEAARINARLQPWLEYETAQGMVEEAADWERRLTEQIKAVDEEKNRLLAEAAIPVEGLTFAEDGTPLYAGRPLEDASGAERITLAVQVALATSPALRVCLLDEANDLDLDSLQALDALAREHGFQIWAVRIGLEGDGEVVVDDGEARTREPAHA